MRREIDAALDAHGLIKVRVFSDDRAAREAMLADWPTRSAPRRSSTSASCSCCGGRRPPKEKAEQAKTACPGPKVVKVLKFSKSGNHRPQVKKVTVLGNMRLAAGGTLKRARRRRPASLKKPT